jgi:ribosome biogenesis GTPase
VSLTALATGTVIGVEGGSYTLALDGGRQALASLRGRLKQESRTGDKIVIGDRVEVQEAEDGAVTIEALLPRRTTMVRRGAGGRKAKVLAANLDRVFVVVAVEPTPRDELIDRLMVVAEANDVPPVLLLNKLDLPGGAEVAAALAARYEAVGYQVLGVSAKADIGIAPLRALVCQGTSAFMGPSGMGKSTILNVIEPGLQLRTGELSKKSGHGRHTTVSSRLITLSCGGAVADTPGFSDVGLWEMDPADLDRCFPEMRGLGDSCRFRGCAHVKEPDCAVRSALAAGDIAPERYESYLVLRREAEEASKQW